MQAAGDSDRHGRESPQPRLARSVGGSRRAIEFTHPTGWSTSRVAVTGWIGEKVEFDPRHRCGGSAAAVLVALAPEEC